MLSQLFLTLVNMLVVEPAQAEIGNRLAKLGAPPAITKDVTSCVTAAAPILAQLYSEDPVRGVVTAFRLWSGTTTYSAVLRAEVPACEPALLAAEPYLARPAS
ncbi:hypothetical protein [Ancylobacter defluvii]|uniref:Uncharacterized protein n=1 Tax=Ancylobacter defluvii TaxID=1282440 RepID=A0A9W6JXD0_9HYPH|nr:hypothetical protein [Ancylobacter defluvii]MBS7586339.1 hypothetical protein [Ancylobacter defluvii]GLK85620.1 hypothetical protein GCM10017653_36900 [Ancylobacter defluvii]